MALFKAYKYGVRALNDMYLNTSNRSEFTYDFPSALKVTILKKFKRSIFKIERIHRGSIWKLTLLLITMSLLPFVLGYEYPRQHRCPSRLLDQDFGLALTPDDLLLTASPLFSEDYYRPWRQLAAAARDVGSSIKADKDKFQVNLDVQHFTPEEISVKTADGYIVVEGKHEEKKDEHGYISRQFTRRYALPEGCSPDTVESRLSSDGVLSITAPRKVPDAVKGERKVPIAQTGPVRKEIKDQNNQTNEQNGEAK